MKSGYLLGSTHADDVLMRILGRVSVARMATVKPHGWVHASLQRVRVGTSFPKWSELDNQIMKILLCLCVSLLLIGCQTSNTGERINVLKPNGGNDIVVADFSTPFNLEPLPAGWHHKTFWFSPEMEISFIEKMGVNAARFETNNGGSMLFRQVEIPLADYHMFKWKWLIEKSINSSLDEKTPEGDDSPARIFVSFKVPGEKVRAFELIWGIKLKREDKKFPHGFSHYVVRGQGDALGKWYEETLDIQKIYNDFWPDKKPAIIDTIAFFCDSDNTGDSSIAYFSGLTISKQ